jgi:chloride channel protein, CIC family
MDEHRISGSKTQSATVGRLVKWVGRGQSFPEWLRWRFTDGQRFLFLCIVSGVLCGFTAVGFHFSIHWVYSNWSSSFESMQGWKKLLVMVGTPALAGAVVGLLLQYVEPSASGSGIPRTKQAYYQNFGYIPLKEAFFRFLAGTIFVGFGNSLGREGPTVHICSAVASKVGQWAGLAKSSLRAMIPVGMGAGIAAAFNTPIAAIFFVFEELLEDFSSKALGGILVAVVIAAVVSRSMMGEHPAFLLDLPTYRLHMWMLVVIAMGVAGALLGHLWVGLLLWLRLWVRRVKVPSWVKPALGGLGVGLVATTVYGISNGSQGVFSIGYEDLSAVLGGNLILPVILALFIGKFIATLLAYCFGGSGGIFAPVLFLGGMFGGLFGEGMELFFQVPEGVDAACALLGMGIFLRQ